MRNVVLRFDGQMCKAGVGSSFARATPLTQIACAAVFVLCCLVLSLSSNAQDVPQTFVCGDLTASNLHASKRSSADESTGQQVMLEYKGEKPGSGVTWFHDGMAHHESVGLGIPMKAGFVILIIADDRAETYVFNFETFTLLLSITSWENSGLANPIKTLRGICKPAGIMVQ